MKKTEFKIVFALMGLSLFFIAYKTYFEHTVKPPKSPGELKNYRHACEEAVEKVIVKAKKGIKDRVYLAPLGVVEVAGSGFASSDKIASLVKSEINDSVSKYAFKHKYRKLKIVVSEKERKDISKRIGRIWKNQAVFSQVYAIKFYPPNHWLKASLKKLPENGKIGLSLKLSDRSGLIIADSSAEFHSPKYIEEHKIKLEDYERKKRILSYGTYLSFAGLGSSLLFIAWGSALVKIKRRRFHAEKEKILSQCQKYFGENSFVAAYELIKKHLDIAPGDEDLLQRMERLRAVLGIQTNEMNIAELRKAEQAHIQALKMMQLIEKIRSVGFFQYAPLSEKEKKNIESLLQYNPNLREMYDFYRKVEERAKAENEIERKISHCRELAEAGRLQSAASEAENIGSVPKLDFPTFGNADSKKLLVGNDSSDLPGNKEVSGELAELRKTLGERIEELNRKFQKAEQALSEGKILECEKLLKEITRENTEMEKAKNLLSEIEDSRKCDKLRLAPEGTGKEVVLFKKNMLTVFRRRKEKPDIEPRGQSVSHDHHLRISVRENKVIAEDQNSTFGTYIRGEKIKISEVEDGDVINLAHGFRMTVHIERGESGGSYLTIASETIAGPKNKTRRKEKNIGAVVFDEIKDPDAGRRGNSSNENRIFIMLLEKVPVSFKSIGIIYEKNGECSFNLEDGIVFLMTPEGTRILYPGAEIKYRGITYWAKDS